MGIRVCWSGMDPLVMIACGASFCLIELIHNTVLARAPQTLIWSATIYVCGTLRSRSSSTGKQSTDMLK